MRKLSKNFFSFPKKRIFFLWIISLWAPSIFSFDSHEHVYLGECLELKYEGDDPTYKAASHYKEAYEKIATHNKLSGTLCDRVTENDVYRIKLNQFNFKDHQTLRDPYTFEVYRKNSKWNDLPYTSSEEYIPIYRISTNGDLKALDTNELKEIAKKKDLCPMPTKIHDKWEEKRIFKNLDKNSFYKKNVEGKENTWAQNFGTVYKAVKINIVTENYKKLRKTTDSLNIVVGKYNGKQIAILIPSTEKNNFKEFRVQTLNDLWNYLGKKEDGIEGSSYQVSIRKDEVKEDTWSIGEIISIAGDYIGLTIADGQHPTKAPAISDPLFEDLTTAADLNKEELRKKLEKVAQNVLRAFNYLKKWSGNPFLPSGFPDKDLTTWFREDIVKKELMDVASIHEATKTKVTFDSSSHRQKYVTGKRALHQAASQLTIKSHDNLALLSANVDHFAPDAQYVYQVGHNLACSFAMSAKNSFKEKKDRDLANRILSEAYGIEAFVSHYLSDLFSAGHVRAPRRAFKEIRELGKQGGENWFEKSVDIAGNLVHDVDGWLGLKVCNGPSCNNEWTVYGDNSLFDKKSKQNREEAIKTLQAGFDEIRACYDSI